MTIRHGATLFPHRPRLATLALALLSLLPASASAAGVGDPLESYRRARPILDRGLMALGGKSVTDLKALEFSYEGAVLNRLQSPSPKPPFLESPQEGRFVYALGGRTYEELTTSFAGGLVLKFRRAYDDASGWMLRTAEEELIELSPANIARLRSFAPGQFMPHDLVRTALSNLASLRHEGTGSVGGERADMVRFSDSGGRTFRMAFSADSGLPLSSSTLGTDIVLGDVLLSTRYGDYRSVDGVAVPHALEFTTAGQPTVTQRITSARTLPAVDDELFRRPEGIPLTRYAERWKPRKLADGVFSVRLWNGAGFTWNVLIVAFDDFVAVLEAPLSDRLHAVVSAVAAGVAPGKSIRYVIPTHHHLDHIAGLKAYMAAGATVVSTPATVEFARTMARAPITLAPNPLAGREGGDPPGGFQAVEGHEVIRGGERELHLYDVGPNPHAREILIAHLPAERILFVTDLFSAPESGRFGPPPASLTAFAGRLEELDLQVETIVPGHGAVSSMADFRRALMAGDRP